MGFLDNVKVPGGGTANQPAGTGGFLSKVKVPQDTHSAFAAQGVLQQYANARANALAEQAKQVNERKTWNPIKSTVEGWKAYQPEQKVWNYPEMSRQFVKEGGNVVAETMADMAMRTVDFINKVVVPTFTDKETTGAEKIASTGELGMGVINTVFSPITGALHGASNIPVLGHAADFVNRLFGAFGGFGSDTAQMLLWNTPIISDETKEELDPLVSEIGGLMAMIVGGKYTAKVGGKVGSGIAKSKYVEPRIKALQDKTQKFYEILRNDPKINTEVARFVAEHGPVRTLPVTSKTPGTTEVPVTETQKYIAEAKKQGYEPYTPEAELPVIEAGTGAGGGGAPSRVSTEGLPVIDATGRMTPTQEPLPIPEGGIFPSTPISRGEQSAPIRGSAAEVQRVPGTSESTAPRPDVVTVNEGTYRLSGDALARYQEAKMKYDETVARLNAEYARASAGRRQQIQSQLKAEGMQWSALKREITGNLTAAELGAKLKFEKTNYKGKTVLVEVNGKWVKGEVIGTAYGRIKVRLKDGAEVSVTKDRIKDPRTTDEIKEQVSKREGVEEYDPTKTEEAIEPTRAADERDITVEPVKETVTPQAPVKKAPVAPKSTPQVSAAQPASSGGLPQAIQGSGPLRTPSVTRRAIGDFADETAKNIDLYKEADPRYGQMNIQEDAAIAHKIVANDMPQALDLAFGRTFRPDVTNTSVWRVLIEKADLEGNVPLVYDLAHSPVAQTLVRGGQEAVALRGLGKFNSSKVIADVDATRAKRFEKRMGKKPEEQIKQDIADIEKSIYDTVKNDPKMREKIIKFLEDIQCK